jgi:hypothetical protein
MQAQYNYGSGSYDPWAMPAGVPNYNPIYDPLSMGMASDIQGQLSGINPDTTALSKFRAEATRTGPSAWSALMRQQQAEGADTSRARGAQELAGQTAQANAGLAMRGGLTSGARERVAKSGARDYLNMSQDVARQQGVNNLQVGINDEQNRIQQLSMEPGMENANAGIGLDKLRLYGQAKQIDTANTMKNTSALNDYNMDRYKTQMGAWAADQQATATQNSGKK